MFQICKPRLTLIGLLGVSLLPAADLSVYREFHFGASVGAVAKLAATDPSEVKTIHRRPALIQELTWRPGYEYSLASAGPDPIQEGIFRFYNGELFQIITTYDRHKIEGMSAGDLIQAISGKYGTATTSDAVIVFHSNYSETVHVLARWEDEDYSYNLIRTGDQTSFALVLSSKRLEALAQAAIAEALRLDVVEAPQRAIDLKNKQDSDGRLLLDKARLANLSNFRP